MYRTHYRCLLGRCAAGRSLRLKPRSLVNARSLARGGTLPLPDEQERLKILRRGERMPRVCLWVGSPAMRHLFTTVVIFAGISLVVGYVALKASPFSSMASYSNCRPLVVAGPSGSGKSTLIKKLFEEFPHEMEFSISHTSRKPRPKEVHGREYYFSTREEMEAGVKRGDFIETAEYSGNLYGTSKASVAKVQSLGKVCVLDIDMQGVQSLKKTNLNPVYVFIRPPSLDELEKRLRSRKTDNEDSIRKRLEIADAEMEYAKEVGSFDHVVVNDLLDTAYTELKSIVMKEIDVLRKAKTQSEN